MQIDRSRFLVLTASIAGGACGSSSSPSSGPVVVASPRVTLPETEDGQTVARKPNDTNDEEALRAVERAQSGGERGDTFSCIDDGVPPTGCSSLRSPGPHCESFSQTKSMCSKFARGLRPSVAASAVDCILARSGKRTVCDFGLASQCGLAAVQRACIEPTTQSACAPIVKSCGGSLDLGDCQRLLSAVTKRNRRNMISCITEGCSIDYCMYDVE